jgi:YegS/Rv2252/BmrU family lipid kinase
MTAHKTVVIVNPAARGGWPRRKWPVLEPVLRGELGSVDIRFTSRVGEGRTLAREAARRGAELVVALGGDGTVSEVASGLLGAAEEAGSEEAPCALGYLPCATGGDLRRTLGSPDEIAEAARRIATGRERLLDAGRIDYTDFNGRTRRGHFLNVASCGLSGLVDHLVNDSPKALPGKAAFLLASLRATARYKNPAVRIRLDDRPGGAPALCEELRLYLLAVANGGYFGGGMHIAPEAAIDDGLFDVVLLGDLSRLEALQLGARIYRGEHTGLPKVRTARARSVRAEPVDRSAKVLLDVDGETPGKLPATWSVLPGALRYRG